MSIEEYAKKIAKMIDGEVLEKKTCVGKLYGVHIRKNGPVIYVEKAYREGIAPEEAALSIREIYEYGEDPQIDGEMITDWERVKHHLKARLQHEKTHPEVFRSARAYMLDDLVIVPYVEVEMSVGEAAAPVSTNMLEVWNQSPQTVIDIALENTKKECCIHDMYELMKEARLDFLMAEREPLGDEAPEMLICTTKKRCWGAIAAIFLQEELVKHFGTGYTLIPASVHEMIAVNRRGFKVFNRIVREVNEQISERERLSNHAYQIW